MTKTTFLGIDLAWRSDRNSTGATCLNGDRSGVELVAVSPPLWGVTQVLEFVQSHSGVQSVIAVDAPLIIANVSGQRPCETLVGQRYGGRDASCHTSNLTLYPSASSVALAKALETEGFIHADGSTPVSTRTLTEVYPHAGMVALFDLPKIIKYKKGSVVEKRAGLAILRDHLRGLEHCEPRLRVTAVWTELLNKDISRMPGPALKVHEDSLDALFCAYLAYYLWYWSWTKNEIFGDIRTGYIVNPSLVRGGIRRAA